MVRMIDTGVPITMLNEQYRIFDEEPRLAEVHTARVAIDRLNDEKAEPEDFQYTYKGFNRSVWRGLQEFYTQHHARGIITTAATAMSPHLCRFSP